MSYMFNDALIKFSERNRIVQRFSGLLSEMEW